MLLLLPSKSLQASRQQALPLPVAQALLLQGMSARPATARERFVARNVRERGAAQSAEDPAEMVNGQPVKCFVCKGTGWETCYHCNGTGFRQSLGVQCSFYGGTGKIKCSSCGGTGYELCIRCMGTGKCSECNGTGSLTCPDCNG